MTRKAGSNALCLLPMLLGLALGCTIPPNPDNSDAGPDQDGRDAGPEEEREFTVIGSASNGEVKVELGVYDVDALRVGRNEIAFVVTDEASGDRVWRASIAQAPLMTMDDDSHSCPHTNPVGDANGSDRFPAKIVFQMASGAMGSWSDEVTVTPAGGDAQTVTIEDIDVEEGALSKGFTGDDDADYVATLSWTSPGSPKTGNNAFVLTVHRQESMMVFTPATDLSIDLTPMMTSMGHGSSGNVDPTHDVDGEYRGSVNFTMGGEWNVTFTMERGSQDVAEIDFDIDV